MGRASICCTDSLRNKSVGSASRLLPYQLGVFFVIIFASHAYAMAEKHQLRILASPCAPPLLANPLRRPSFAVCPMSLVWLELLELMKGRSGVALTQFSSNSSSGSNPPRAPRDARG